MQRAIKQYDESMTEIAISNMKEHQPNNVIEQLRTQWGFYMLEWRLSMLLAPPH